MTPCCFGRIGKDMDPIISDSVTPTLIDNAPSVQFSFVAAAKQAYLIQRSGNGRQWMAIGIVPAGGTRTVEIVSRPTAGPRFYRAVPTGLPHL